MLLPHHDYRGPVPDALEAEWTKVQTKEEVKIDRPRFLGNCDGGPRGEAAKLDSTSLPLAYYDLYWGKTIRRKFQTRLNAYAATLGAGSQENFMHWKPFDQWEIDRSLGFLIHQGLNPRPWWQYHMEDPEAAGSFGTEQCRRLYGEKNAQHRFQELRTFFHVENNTASGVNKDKVDAAGKLIQ